MYGKSEKQIAYANSVKATRLNEIEKLLAFYDKEIAGIDHAEGLVKSEKVALAAKPLFETVKARLEVCDDAETILDVFGNHFTGIINNQAAYEYWTFCVAYALDSELFKMQRASVQEEVAGEKDDTTAYRKVVDFFSKES